MFKTLGNVENPNHFWEIKTKIWDQNIVDVTNSRLNTAREKFTGHKSIAVKIIIQMKPPSKKTQKPKIKLKENWWVVGLQLAYYKYKQGPQV